MNTTRRSKALIIGISYQKPNAPPSSNRWEELDGTVDDAERMRSFLRNKLHYNEVVAITDKTNSAEVSRRNILAKLNWLVEGAREGDILFLHYSGHGWQRPTRRRTEEDGLDETIVPADCPCPAKRQSVDETIPECHLNCSCAPDDPRCWQSAYRGMIRDNELRDILVKPLVQGVRLVTLFDSCHSGSILDLRYHYLPRGAVRPMFSPKGLTTIPPELRDLAKPQSRLEKFRDLLHRESSPCALGEALGKSAEMAFGHGISSASVRMFDDHMHAMRNESQRGVAVSLSACIDHDAVFELEGSRGMLTTFFLDSMKKHKFKVRAEVLIDEMYPRFHSEWERNWSDRLKSSPYPVLSSNQLLDLSSIFLV